MNTEELKNEIQDIIKTYSTSMATGKIADMIVEQLEDMQEHMRSQIWDNDVWTDEIDSRMEDYIKSIV